MAGPVLGNSLPESLQKSESIDIFNKKLKTLETPMGEIEQHVSRISLAY